MFMGGWFFLPEPPSLPPQRASGATALLTNTSCLKVRRPGAVAAAAMGARLHLHRFSSGPLLRRNLPSVHPALFPSAAASTRTDDAPTQVSECFRRGRLIDALRLRLRSHDPSTPFPISDFSPVDTFVAVHALRSAPSADVALCLFRSLRSNPSFSLTGHVLHSLAKTLSASRRVEDLRSLLNAADAGAFPRVQPPSPMDRLRWYATAGDVPCALRAWEGIRADVVTNKRRHPCTESYNLAMGLYAASGMDAEAVKIFQKMVEEGANPNSRTYTVIIEHLVGAGKLENALQVFDRLEVMRIRRTSKQYNVLAEAFSACGGFDGVRRLLVEIQSDGIWPGRAVRAVVAKMREAGFYVEETNEFAKEMLSVDERIGYVVGSSSSDGASDDEDDGVEDGGHGEKKREERRLRPWLDPNALAVAVGNWDPREVSALEEAKLVWTPRLVCKFLRGFKKADTAWRFFCWVGHQKGGFTHERLTVARMIAILARSGHVELVGRLLSKVKADGITLPFGTIRLVVDLYGLVKRADAAMRVFRDADDVCGPLAPSHRRLLCSSLLRTLAKCKRGDEIMELLEEMMLGGVLPDIQTFSGLMQFFASEGDQRRVQELAGMVRQCGLSPDAFMYQTLIRSYIKHHGITLALRTFEDMRNANLAPDAATKNLLVKILWNDGKLREAAHVEERSEEVQEGLPFAQPGHVWTVNSADLLWVYGVYRSSFAASNG